jgi:hypothetical protein
MENVNMSESTEVERLRAWIDLLEAFLKEATSHYKPQSNWGRKKKALLARRKEFIPSEK